MSNDPEVHSEWDCNLGESVFIIIIQENVQTYYPSEPFRITRFQETPCMLGDPQIPKGQ